jgi:DGQHR domain-containing protein
MKLRRSENVAKIIDGQHRIAGLRDFNGTFQLNVTVFVDMDISDQAMLFSTINLKQTRVHKSLAYDLYEFAHSRSPQKTCHNIAKLLNKEEGSAFKDKIKILGRATPGKPFETLTQATFVEKLLFYISSNPMQDRNILKQSKKLSREEKPETRLIFRNMFIDKKDAEIARILYNYFGAVAKRWPNAWWSTNRSDILSRTTGFTALMRLLGDIYPIIERPEQVISESVFNKVFAKMELNESSFTTDVYNPGGGGQTALYRDLLDQWQRQR